MEHCKFCQTKYEFNDYTMKWESYTFPCEECAREFTRAEQNKYQKNIKYEETKHNEHTKNA